MSAPTNGGPAFPTSNGGSPDDGMTLRDYFAAKALSGLLAHPECDYTPMKVRAVEQAALDAYSLADAMLKVKQE